MKAFAMGTIMTYFRLSTMYSGHSKSTVLYSTLNTMKMKMYAHV